MSAWERFWRAYIITGLTAETIAVYSKVPHAPASHTARVFCEKIGKPAFCVGVLGFVSWLLPHICGGPYWENEQEERGSR